MDVTTWVDEYTDEDVDFLDKMQPTGNYHVTAAELAR